MASLAFLALGTAGSLRADFKDFSNRCFPGVVRACASIQVFTAINAGGGTDVTILVRNLQGWDGGADNTRGSLLSRIGLTASTPMVGASHLTVRSVGAQVVNSAGGWTLARTGGRGGPIELTAGRAPGKGRSGALAGGIAGCDAPRHGLPASYFRTCDGGWVAITFTTTNAWSANDAEVAWLTQQSANGDGAQGFECGSAEGSGREECSVVTPEPVTILLLGSGLAGLGGVGAFRRRRGHGSLDT